MQRVESDVGRPEQRIRLCEGLGSLSCREEHKEEEALTCWYSWLAQGACLFSGMWNQLECSSVPNSQEIAIVHWFTQ